MDSISKKKTFCFDLDETLCRTRGLNYEKSEPIQERIDFVNSLHAQGHTIIVDTARGSVTGEDWTSVTTDQLNGWGLKYHTLRCGHKFAADVYIDDKAFNSEDFF